MSIDSATSATAQRVGMPAAMQAPRANVLAITSGKGGVGKTFLAANLAAALVRQGERVLVLDADLGLANLDVALNLLPKVTMHDVFTGRSSLDDAILPAPGGFSVLLAGSGLVEYSHLTYEVREKLLHIIETIAPRYDRILLDTGAGISDVVLFAISLAAEVLVVVTPEPTSMTDAYATIKVLAAQQQRRNIHLVINQTSQAGEGRLIHAQLQKVVDQFVSPRLPGAGKTVKLELLGEIPTDPSVRDAVQRRRLLLELSPGCVAARSVGAVAGKFAGKSSGRPAA